MTYVSNKWITYVLTNSVTNPILKTIILNYIQVYNIMAKLQAVYAILSMNQGSVCSSIDRVTWGSTTILYRHMDQNTDTLGLVYWFPLFPSYITSVAHKKKTIYIPLMSQFYFLHSIEWHRSTFVADLTTCVVRRGRFCSGTPTNFHLDNISS